MSIAKVIEVTARSPESFERAIEEAVDRVTATIHGVKEAWVMNQKVIVTTGKPSQYQVDLKVTFLLDSTADSLAQEEERMVAESPSAAKGA